MRALALVCTLKPSPAESSSAVMADQILVALAEHGVERDVARVVDYDVRPGVAVDMGDGGQWPQLRERLVGGDVRALGRPAWVGHMSRVAERELGLVKADAA